MTAKTGLELLDDVLAIYGSDRSRWPSAARQELATLVASSAQARKMLAEAEALDRLLDHAPKVSDERVALLADRIAAQAARTPRMTSIPGSANATPRRSPAPAWRHQAAGITALAASLVLGILVGQNASFAPAVSEIATVVGIESLGDGSQVASTDEAYIGIDEDML